MRETACLPETLSECLEQQAFDETTLVLRDEVLLAALDKLTTTVVAMMVLLAIVDVPIFLILGGLASRTHISDNHSVLLTSTGWIRVFGSTVTQKSGGEHYMDITTSARLPARCTRIFRGLSSLSLLPIRTQIWYRRFRFGVRAIPYTVTSGRLR